MIQRYERSCRAFSLVEVTIMLIVVTVITGVMAPVISAAVNRSKVARARTDVAAIKTALLNMLEDTHARGVVRNGSDELSCQESVYLLVSDGDTPAVGTDGSSQWAQPVDFGKVDFIEYHLTSNRPGNDPKHAYASWNGAYLTGPIGPDPWGNRYMINVRYLFSGNRYDVVVLSAGPDEEIDSEFTQDGFAPGDDDIVSLVSSGTVVRGGKNDHHNKGHDGKRDDSHEHD